MVQRLLAWLPAILEDWPIPNHWMAHPPSGTTVDHHPSGRSDDRFECPSDTLRVLSWNIHYGYGTIMHHGRGPSESEVMDNLHAIAATIRRLAPDIVALQEVDRRALRSHDIDQLAWLTKQTGFEFSAWTPTWDVGWVPYPGRDPSVQIGRVFSGQAVLSRFPIENARRHALPQPPSRSTFANLFYLHRALLEVDIAIDSHRKLRVFNAHLEAFDNENRDHQAHITAGKVSRSGRNVILLGDMNSVPPEASLRHNFPDEPSTDMRDDRTIRIFREIPGIREVGGTEKMAGPSGGWLTFPAHEPNRQLDYLFYGAGLELIDGKVDSDTPAVSDHHPVIATLSLKPSSTK